MQVVIKHAIYVFLVIFFLTMLLCIGALGFLWYSTVNGSTATDLPYLRWLLGAGLVEVIGVVVLFAKKGLKYLPEVEVNSGEAQTLEFMKKFISSGSSVTIVSNRVAWLGKSDPIKDSIRDMARNGTSLEVITPAGVANDIRAPLEKAGVVFHVTGEDIPPEARFTLVNGHRSGAEKLAIARGGHPEHEITIFDNNSGPQIIAMAKDIIRKSKELAHAR